MSSACYATYLPASLLPELPVPACNPAHLAQPLPPGTYGFTFFRRREISLDGQTLRGPPAPAPLRYLFGEELTAAEAADALRQGHLPPPDPVDTPRRAIRTWPGHLLWLDETTDLLSPDLRLERQRQVA